MASPLTCLTWHDIAPRTRPETAHLGATTPPDAFARQLEHLQRHYTIIDLDRLLAGDLPPRAALLTFDDAYASIAHIAAPMLAARKLPSVLFVNPAPIASHVVPLDSLASLFASRYGAARLASVASDGRATAATFGDVMNDYIAHKSLVDRDGIKSRLLAVLGIPEVVLHASLGVFMTPQDLAGLPRLGMEVANHTFSHVHCGALSQIELDHEIAASKTKIESLTGRPVRAFAFPWGRRHDATAAAMATIRRSGHAATFLVHGRNNATRPAPDVWYRVLLRDETGARLRAALTLLPALREARARLTTAAPFPTPQPEPRSIATG